MLTFFEKYKKQAMPKLMRDLNKSNVLALPKMEKVVINAGIGRLVKDPKFLEIVMRDLSLIAGQKAVPTKSKKSIANFKTREGMTIGVKATLRGVRMYDFIGRLIGIALPRTRDFRGLNAKSLDKKGNLTIGIKEHIVFPEISAEEVRNIFGFEVTVAVKAKNKDEALALYKALGFPIKT